jgi:hypothetical protein
MRPHIRTREIAAWVTPQAAASLAWLRLSAIARASAAHTAAGS